MYIGTFLKWIEHIELYFGICIHFPWCPYTPTESKWWFCSFYVRGNSFTLMCPMCFFFSSAFSATLAPTSRASTISGTTLIFSKAFQMLQPSSMISGQWHQWPWSTLMRWTHLKKGWFFLSHCSCCTITIPPQKKNAKKNCNEVCFIIVVTLHPTATTMK